MSGLSHAWNQGEQKQKELSESSATKSLKRQSRPSPSGLDAVEGVACKRHNMIRCYGPQPSTTARNAQHMPSARHGPGNSLKRNFTGKHPPEQPHRPPAFHASGIT